jgi:hypothetical protein
LKKNQKFDLNGKIKKYNNLKKKVREKNKKNKSKRIELNNTMGLKYLLDPTNMGLTCLPNPKI